MDLKEKQISSKNVFKGTLLNVFQDEVMCPNGKESVREYTKHNGASCIVPFLPNGNLIMEKQFRYPLNEVIYEFPAGKCDLGEDPLKTAIRELKEETGYNCENVTFLGDIYPACAYSTEVIHLYKCNICGKENRHLDEDENLEIVELSYSDIRNLAKKNLIKDAKTLACLTFLELENQ